jgi:hypothetical protein
MASTASTSLNKSISYDEDEHDYEEVSSIRKLPNVNDS